MARSLHIHASAFAALVLAASGGVATAAEPGSTAAAEATAPALPPTALLRSTLVVADVERALAFYRLLGFEPEGEMGGAREPAKTPFPLNAPSTSFRVLILGTAAPGGGRLGLLQFDGPPPAPVRAPRDRIGLGDVVLVVDVPDAVALHARLVAAGVRVVEPPQVYRSRRAAPDGRPMEGRVFHAFDPDGNLVELLQAPAPVDAAR